MLPPNEKIKDQDDFFGNFDQTVHRLHPIVHYFPKIYVFAHRLKNMPISYTINRIRNNDTNDSVVFDCNISL